MSAQVARGVSIPPAPIYPSFGGGYESFLFPFTNEVNWGQVDNRDMQMSPSAEKSTVPNSDEDKSLHDDMPIKEEDSQGRKRAKVPSSNSGEEKDDPNVFEIKKIKNRESAKRSRDKKKKMENEKDMAIRELQERNDALARDNANLQSKVRCLETENASLGEEIRHLLNIVYGVGRRIGQVFNSIPHICPQISPGTGAASAVIFLLFIAFYVYNPMLAFLTSAQNVRGPFGLQRNTGTFSISAPPPKTNNIPDPGSGYSSTGVPNRALLSDVNPATTSMPSNTATAANTATRESALVIRPAEVSRDQSPVIDYVLEADTKSVYMFDANAKRFKPVMTFPYPMPIETHVFGVHGRGGDAGMNDMTPGQKSVVGRLVQINLNGDGDMKQSILAYIVGMNYGRKTGYSINALPQSMSQSVTIPPEINMDMNMTVVDGGQGVVLEDDVARSYLEHHRSG